MRDVVIVPCYERPEYTCLGLQYLSRARGIRDKEVWLCQDNHENGLIVDPNNAPKDFAEVALYLGMTFGSRAVYRSIAPHSTYGNSKNLVDGLKAAYDSGAERIFLVEDDIIVAPDIFEWHEAVLEEKDVFVSCATALNKSAHFQVNGPNAMDPSDDSAAYKTVQGAYSSHAVAFKRKNLDRLLSYVTSFSKWESGFEQDMLTQRFMRIVHKASAWPYVPRAYNVGVYSYHINTGRKLTGTLKEKTRALDQIIHDPDKLRDMSANNSAVTSIPAEWPVRTEPVKNVQRFR